MAMTMPEEEGKEDKSIDTPGLNVSYQLYRLLPFHRS